MICEKRHCTGCYACYNVCPKNAINMEKDEYGNVYPVIDLNKCINCGLCKKVCPQLKDKLNFHEPINTYAMYNKDPKKRKESTSGGAASTFYENILLEGGVVYGASNLFRQDSFKFIRITKVDELYKVKGSKYVHCYIDDIFKQVKKDLNENKKVLFIGTPCQISGLYCFLMRDYDNLITVDIICHGVPSQQLLFEQIKEIGFNSNDISYVFFRDESKFNFTLMDENKKVLFSKLSSSVSYYRNFLRGNIYRENCYSCRYAKKERISDITIGDFWGLDKKSNIYDDETKGISVIITNTEKGENLINSISKESLIEKRTFNEAAQSNGQLNEPMKKTKYYKIYLDNYTSLGYSKTMKKMCNFKDKLKIVLMKNEKIFKFIKNIKSTLKNK